LDELDLIRRVNYQPAIVGGLPASVVVTRVIVSEGDLYLLDGENGNVLRAQNTEQGYEIDPEFKCGPDAAGTSNVGPLIDVVPWSAGYDPAANVLALDSGGNVLYCQEGEDPFLGKLTSPPSDAWGNIVVFTLDLGDSYVLDLPSNGVWVYWRSFFGEEPTLFFDQEIPYLQDVIDMAVNRDDLYLLHVDGHLSFCVYSGFQEALTRCTEPSYVDFRPGHENTPMVPPPAFNQVLVTQPPDPSLYLLEGGNQAIYHFSLRNLAFQQQYLPESPLSAGDATAYTVDPVQRTLYLAVGNQVFHGTIP
jgi:hypothetical protein